MNRRSFIAGILAACVAPAILIPKAPDHARWKFSRRRGLYIAEYQYVVMSETLKDGEEVVLFDSREPDSHFDPNPDYLSAGYDLNVPRIDPGKEYAGKWSFIEWHGPPSYVPAQT